MSNIETAMPRLRCVQGLTGDIRFTIDQEKVTIGRNPDCQIRLGANDDNRRVSRRHASIQKVGQEFQLLDLESRNGTMHEGVAMTPYVPAKLEHGDRITICEFEFVFEEPGVNPPSSAQVMLVDSISQSNFLSSIDSNSGWEVQTSMNSETKLRATLQLVRNLQGKVGTTKVLREVLGSLLNVFPAYDIGVAVLYEPTSSEPITISCSQPGEVLPDVTHVSRSIVGNVMDSQTAVVSHDLQQDHRFDGESVLSLPWRAIMCVPLINSSGASFGVLHLQSSKVNRDDSFADLDLFSTVAVTVSQLVETNHLLEATAKQRELVKELEIAQRIQFAILPRNAPSLAGYSFYEYYSPCEYIGGDYYDYIPLNDGRLAIVLADVQGHGIPSALVMTKLSGELKIRLAQDMPITEVVAQTSDSVAESGVDRFVTMLLLVLNPESGEIEFVNAGHPYPLLINAQGEVRALEGEGGMPLGIFEGQEYPLRNLSLQQGELLMVYTDGITEAMRDDEQYGSQRLLSTCKQTYATNGESVVKDVIEFQGASQDDDMCLVSVRRD